jgi:hypothetical protein
MLSIFNRRFSYGQTSHSTSALNYGSQFNLSDDCDSQDTFDIRECSTSTSPQMLVMDKAKVNSLLFSFNKCSTNATASQGDSNSSETNTTIPLTKGDRCDRQRKEIMAIKIIRRRLTTATKDHS